LGAQSLINSAKRQAVIKDLSNFKIAINAFKLEYEQLPGDFDEASLYWPSDCTDGPFNYCDGDDDKIIAEDSTEEQESLRAWQHMGLAEILPQEFSGGPDSNLNSRWGISTQPYDINSIPSSNYADNMGWVIGYTRSLPQSYLNGKQCLFIGNMTEYSANTYTIRNGNDNGVFTIKEIYDFDKKLDDGKPFLGEIISLNWTAYSMVCQSGTSYNTGASYFDTKKGCGMCFVF
jgi:hypothetical protein